MILTVMVQQEYAPFTWSGVTSSGTKYPQIVNGVDGVYYQATAYYAAGWRSGAVRLAGSLARNILVVFIQGMVRDPTIGHASDEPMAYSSGGRLIYWSLCCDREAGAYDVTIPSGQPNRDWYYFGYNLASNSMAPGYQQMYNSGDETSYNDGDGWQIYRGKNQSKNGLYGKHSTAQSPPIPYRGKLYLLKGNALLAFGPTDTNAQTPLPLAETIPVQRASIHLTTAVVIERLETEVRAILDAGHLRPGYHTSSVIERHGNGNYTDERELGEISDYFQSPADTVYTLLLAYPHLSAATQRQVIGYTRDNYGPGKEYDLTTIVHVGWGTGAAREIFDIPKEISDNWGEPYQSPFEPSTQPICGWCGYWENFPPFSFYAAWQYAQVVGDNDPIIAKELFDRMGSKLEAPLNDTTFRNRPHWLNQYIAGYKGYLELQQLAGYAQDQDVIASYEHMLALRTEDFDKDSPYPLSLCCAENWEESYNNTLAVARNFMFLTPELADYLNQHAYTQVQEAVSEYEYVAPYWFVAKFDSSYGEGTFQHLYDYPALFQAKARILKQPYEDLVKWLDVPAFYRGDLFYIQNLVAALSAVEASPYELSVVPSQHVIKVGESASAEVEVTHRGGFTGTVTVEVDSDSIPALRVDVQGPYEFSPPGGKLTVTMTSLDGDRSSAHLGQWYRIPVTGSGGGSNQVVTIDLLVASRFSYFPSIVTSGSVTGTN